MADEFRPAVDSPDFFDWASTAPVSVAAAAAMGVFARQQAEATDPPGFLTVATRRADLARSIIRSAFGARPGDEVVLVRSVAEGASILAAGYPLDYGSSIVVTAADHEAAVAPWLRRGRASGVEVRTVPLTPDGAVDLDTFDRTIDCRTAVVCVSHVSHLDGIRQPIAELAAITRNRSTAIMVVDGAQAVGRIPVSVTSLDADIYLAGGRKALLAPIGTGFMIGTADALSRIDPHILSTRNARVELSPAAGWELRGVAQGLPSRIEGNLPDLRCMEGLRASIAAYMVSDPEGSARQTQSLVEQFVSECTERDISVLSPTTVCQTGIMRAAVGTAVDHQATKQALADSGLRVAATRSWLRVSLLPFNPPGSIARLVDEMAKAARRAT